MKARSGSCWRQLPCSKRSRRSYSKGTRRSHPHCKRHHSKIYTQPLCLNMHEAKGTHVHTSDSYRLYVHNVRSNQRLQLQWVIDVRWWTPCLTPWPATNSFEQQGGRVQSRPPPIHLQRQALMCHSQPLEAQGTLALCPKPAGG